ncbi:ABC transporter permease [Nocardioides panzhihuensis]|uniref:ABC-type transport system involved in multi-copper enzyme maturation permease subunit n=1 Tax=Nocardioides panzhihuensis TaxID=860243 RepID=A0A7Z0IQV8_9ACTN|nr:ABC transporter permease subunit [Nocardioides panzhihuensis]NYI76236.1 ABC-type transport system involved in multi-copper enzyme maturation permease subunit [Nocardioides panzhihuensis]
MTTTTIAPEPASPAGHQQEAAHRRTRAVPAPIPFGRIAGIELRKMFDTRSGFWLVASIGILAVIATAAIIVFSDDDALTYGMFATAIGIPMAVILPMISVLSVSSEWSSRTALTTFTLVPSRGKVIGAKAVLTVALGVVSMTAALGIGALGNLLGTSIAGVDPVWDLTAVIFAQTILAQIIGMLMGFMLGTLFRSSPAAIVGYFVYALVLPTISNALVMVNEWWRDNGSWLDLNWASTRLFDNDMTREAWAQLGTASAIWLLVPLLIGLRLVLKSEVK